MKKLVKKGLLGLTFSSNPLAINYGYSAELKPNYNNSFSYDLGILKSNSTPNYAEELGDWYQKEIQPTNNQIKLGVGLAASGDKSPVVSAMGKQMSKEVVDDTSKKASSIFPTSLSKGDLTNFFDKIGGWNTIGAVSDALGSIMPEKDEYSGVKGDVTLSIDSVYDSASDILMTIPGWGLIAGGIMKVNSVLGKGINAIGGGTDGMCVCAGTKVFKANGEIVNIENLKQEDGIIGWCEREKRIKPQTISLLIEPRLKDCVEIILDSGQVLRCSFDHPIYTRNGVFIPAYLLKIGDIVLSADLNSNIYKSEVVSILPIGILTVYNLQADNDHTYLANGIITHNTTADAILGSSFLLLSPLGLINGFGGKKTDTITKNEEAFELVGSSYGGTEATVDDALKYSGKKYGLFSNRARKKANLKIMEAKRLQNIMDNIADTATDRFNIQLSTAAINENRRAFALQGGYLLANIRVGRSGMSLDLVQKARLIIKALKGKKIKPIYSDWIKTVPKGRLSNNYDLEKAFEVFPFEELENWRKATDEELENGKYHLYSVYELPNGDYEFLKLGTEETNPEIHWETDTYYDGSNGLKETHDLIFDKDRNRYYYRRKLLKYREGGIIPTIIELSNPKYVKEFHDGGLINNSTIIELVEPNILKDINKFLEGGKTNRKSRTLEELIEYAKKENPRFVQRMSEPVKDIEFIDKEGNKARGTHYLAWNTDDNGNAIVHPTIMEDDNGNLKYYGDDSYRRAIEKHDFLVMTPEEAELFTVSGEDENGNLFGYKVGWKEFFKAKKYQEGGSVNVIPEGALHARKHHMDMEGITPKGIPVVSNNGEQQAEIEREELILRLEVTKRLEELCKKYYSEESNTSEKDLYALEAGKLLTDEILHNTIDNTNLIKLI